MHPKKGMKIKDELCYCTHPKSIHGRRYAVGHGMCMYESCDCRQFTFEKYVWEKVEGSNDASR
jgi:hypothetical protein